MQKIKSLPVWLKASLLIIWTYLGDFIAQILIYLPFLLIFGKNSTLSPFSEALFSILVYALSIYIIVFLPIKLKKSESLTRQDYGLKGLPTFTDLGLAPVAFGAFYIISGILVAVFSNFSWFNVAETQDVGFSALASGWDKFFAFFSLVLVAPVAEEFIFRGFLYGKLRSLIKSKFSIPISIFIVSAFFGFLHGQWNVGVTVFALSVILCLQREITGTIYSGIFLHIIKNALAFYLVYVLGI